ncbi:hypothetical protein NDU88_001182 [Pleurodeles waltl]|uniref:Uncharacterized protein n=1 Tax=Pleurodeles waltl TaxID=8319 RepID=A0AAV7NAB1_PLEWA|nr:hypothetical protein NDU88_001182 [Pleurodeles waltl]
MPGRICRDPLADCAVKISSSAREALSGGIQKNSASGLRRKSSRRPLPLLQPVSLQKDGGSGVPRLAAALASGLSQVPWRGSLGVIRAPFIYVTDWTPGSRGLCTCRRAGTKNEVLIGLVHKFHMGSVSLQQLYSKCENEIA